MSVRDVRRLDTETGVWLILLGATVLTAVLGLEEAGASRAVGLVLLAVAFVKLRLVGLYFIRIFSQRGSDPPRVDRIDPDVVFPQLDCG